MNVIASAIVAFAVAATIDATVTAYLHHRHRKDT